MKILEESKKSKNAIKKYYIRITYNFVGGVSACVLCLHIVVCGRMRVYYDTPLV